MLPQFALVTIHVGHNTQAVAGNANRAWRPAFKDVSVTILFKQLVRRSSVDELIFACDRTAVVSGQGVNRIVLPAPATEKADATRQIAPS